jgi:multiple sugar transport system permease protein
MDATVKTGDVLVETAHAPPRRDTWLAAAMLLPAVLFIVALIGFPIVLAVYYAFTNITTGGGNVTFVGFDNFVRLFDDPTFLVALRNTFFFTTATLVVVIVFSIIQAELLMRNFPGKWLVRFLLLLPWTAPTALAVIGWLWMLDSIFSPIDWFLRHVGLLGYSGALFGGRPNLYWLGDPVLSYVAIVVVSVWRLLPLATVIVLAGLNSVPSDIFEQTHVDRAGYFRRMFHITLPIITPIVLVAVLFTFVFTFSDMIVVYILTRGGPANSTQVLPSLAFFKGIGGGNLGMGAAIALVFAPVLGAISAILLTLIRRQEAK